MSDITIAFAVDETTAGEVLTKKCAEESSTPFFPIKVKYNGKIPGTERDKLNSLFLLAKKLQLHNGRGVILNVAGNGMFTLAKYGVTQERADEIVFNILKTLKENGMIFHSVRSGGQTGFDESAIKAADKLGIDAFCLAPKGWRFRPADGVDVCDEALFKRRFKNYD